ncbi:hypothetical protein [Haliovirga abyssi]|uniref:Uncharacterized protein n=1 Tax=Haliovirga abyssi TaxID=2996794 RepID=A0AAU9E143_9FUSO|nr:hypothetical protein [Haliovirga abyssi]BDU50085.1 hypothetical protein HLVA_06540 [Haliovirga abyssi]
MEILEEKAKNGQNTYIIENNSKKIYLYSKYDPNKDVERAIKNIDFNEEQIFILLGFGKYHIEKIKKNMTENSNLIIFDLEENIKKLKKYYMKDEKVFSEKNFNEILKYVSLNSKKTYTFIKVNSLYRINRATYDTVQNEIEKLFNLYRKVPDDFLKEYNGNFLENCKLSEAKINYEFKDYMYLLTKEILVTYTRRDNNYGNKKSNIS